MNRGSASLTAPAASTTALATQLTAPPTAVSASDLIAAQTSNVTGNSSHPIVSRYLARRRFAAANSLPPAMATVASTTLAIIIDRSWRRSGLSRKLLSNSSSPDWACI